jgi:hypothetical protein
MALLYQSQTPKDCETVVRYRNFQRKATVLGENYASVPIFPQ